MSLSYLNIQTCSAAATSCTCTLVVGILATGFTGLAQAAQYFAQPTLELAVDGNTNLQLDPTITRDTTEGYIARIGTLLGIATPRSETTVRPELRYQNYPDIEGSKRLEGFLTANTRYESQRSEFTALGQYEHRDELTAELTSARFDPLNPNPPTSPETGRVQVRGTRDLLSLYPSYAYKVTQRLDLGVSALYQQANYNFDQTVPDDTGIDYEYYKGEVFLRRDVTQRSQVSFTPYFSKYKARDLDSEMEGLGGSVSYDMRWSQNLTASARVLIERDKTKQTQPTVFLGSENTWGAEFNLTRRGEISSLMFGIGRTVTPSGGGGTYYTDQFQVQYRRDLSRRLNVLAAAVLLRDRALVASSQGNDREYAQGETELRYMITPTVYVRLGYAFIWQKYELETDNARNHRVTLAIGYQGLDRRR